MPPAGHWDEITSYETLVDTLERICRQEIVVSGTTSTHGESHAIGYACPLFRRTTCIGAIGIAWKPLDPNQTINPQTEKLLCDILRKGAKEIMRRLSFEEKT